MANCYASQVVKIALGEVGYLEKKSNSQLNSKTANAGYNNYTKYARDLDAISSFYNGKKNGYAWCDVFTDWVFVQAFGVEKAKELLCQPDKSYGAGCYYSARYYKNKGQFYTQNPKIGDQIFFWNSSKSDVAHTGIVYDVDRTYVYTVEGNTSSTSGVVANGGGVVCKKYKLNFSLLATPAEGIAGRFTKIDRKEFGKIPGVTDREFYTNSFHVPVYYPISAFEKIEIEAPYHNLCNAGQITYIELDGDPSQNIAAFESVIRKMHDEGIGYGSVNHPVDRDPVCGFSGIITGNRCPHCGRLEGDLPFEIVCSCAKGE